MAIEFTYPSQTDYWRPAEIVWTSIEVKLCEHKHGAHGSVRVGSIVQPIFTCYDCGAQLFIRARGDSK